MHETAGEIESWLVARLSQLLGIEPARIETSRPLTRYGLDSIVAIELTADLEEWLQQAVPNSLLWDEPTIKDIAAFLANPGSSADPLTPSREQAGGEKKRDDRQATRGQEQSPELRARSYSVEPVAIVGLACRTAGADSAEDFWQLLRNGVDAITEVPGERWDRESQGKLPGKRGGFLKEVDRFDPHFFSISPREASQMDPQQRLLLEVTWEALEHAGLPPAKLAGSEVGVFVGISTNDYFRQCAATPEMIDAYTNTGNAHSIAASRLSYFFDWYGPSIAIDTACSSSLVAVHLACQSLHSGESTVALAGGVNIMLAPDATISFAKARMISAEGQCRPFDAGADGLVRGEGCGVVILKRLADAQADGDRILAVIRGSAMNQDGHSNGLTAPSDRAQQRVLRKAHQQAGITAEQPGFIVAQGTGTPLGDATELRALTAVLGEGGDEPCAIASVKANIGHLEAAAGVVSLIAATLALQHEEIPPQLHYTAANPQVSLEHSRLFIPTERQRWRRGERARIVGVSAFSFSGTNTHVVLEESPLVEPRPVSPVRSHHLLTLSALDKQALYELVMRYERLLETPTAPSLSDLCFSANTGRAHFSQRLALVAESKEQLAEELRALLEGEPHEQVFSGDADAAQGKLAFVFSGEGTAYERMGWELYETQPVFRDALDQCAEVLSMDLERPLTSLLSPSEYEPSMLQDITYEQTALFAVEYALAMTWRSWGIEPDAVTGYGVGAYVAACLAGALCLEDALQLVIERCRLLQSVSRASASLLVHASESLVAHLLLPYGERAAIVAVHAPERIVISAPGEDVAAIQRDIVEHGISVSPLPLRYTQQFLRKPALLDAYMRLVRVVPHERLAIPFVSTLMGESLAAGEEFHGEYWRKHLSEPIRLADALETLYRQGIRSFVEIGPASTLSEIGRDLFSDDALAWLPSLSQRGGDEREMLVALGTLYCRGREVNWSGFEKGSGGRLVSLPTYPFQRERCWVASAKSPRPTDAQASARHPLLGKRVHSGI